MVQSSTSAHSCENFDKIRSRTCSPKLIQRYDACSRFNMTLIEGFKPTCIDIHSRPCLRARGTRCTRFQRSMIDCFLPYNSASRFHRNRSNPVDLSIRLKVTVFPRKSELGQINDCNIRDFFVDLSTFHYYPVNFCIAIFLHSN